MPKHLPLVIALFAMSAVNGFTGPAEVPVLFTNSPVTSFGTSVFVVGSIPQIGNWNVTRSTKLVPSNCVGQVCTWLGTIGIPEGTSYQYEFIQRSDCDTCYGNAANVSHGPTNTSSTAAGPPAPYRGKTVFYYSNWSSVSLLYSNTTTTNFVVQPMVPVSNGLWRVDGINRAGETNLIFVFTDNQGNYDNPDNIPGYNYETPLDACVVQNGQIYNYWPPATVSTNRAMGKEEADTPTIRVYLPRGFTQNTTKRYPALYMHDGQNLYQGMGAFGSWWADTNANNLIRFGKMRETIIVGVDNSSDRFCEYDPPGCPYSNCSTPRGDKYVSFLADQLRPHINNTYSITAGRTLTDAENTGALGSSLGGLISAYMGWQWSDVYHRLGCFSSSFQVCFPIPSPDTKRPIRIYVDSGDQSDGLANTVAERDNLINNGYVFNMDLDHTIGYGDAHNEAAWNRRLPRSFQFLFPTSDEPNTVLDTAAPPRVTDIQLAGDSNVVTWTSYRLRTYTVQGVTNETLSSSLNWSNVFTTPTAEPRFWSYPSLGVTNSFHFLRVRENDVPNWPN